MALRHVHRTRFGAIVSTVWELEFHTTLLVLIRTVRNLRRMDCEHCGDLLTEVYNCLSKTTEDIRYRSADGQ
jgi:hypothetical protein